MYIRKGEPIADGKKQIFRHLPRTSNVASDQRIMELMDHQELDENDVRIASFLYDVRVASEEQMERRFTDTDNLPERLRKLVSYRILNEFILADSNESVIPKDALKFYTIDFAALPLLSHYVADEDLLNWNPRSLIMPVITLKKILFTVDFRIALEVKLEKPPVSYDSNRMFTMGRIKLIPNAQAVFEAPGKTADGTEQYRPYLILAAIEDDFVFGDRTRINEELGRYETWFYRNAWDKSFSEAPGLIFVCDTRQTMVFLCRHIEDMVPEDEEGLRKIRETCTASLFDKCRITCRDYFENDLETCLMKYDISRRKWIRTKFPMLKERERK